ncbi:hypothetical protein F9C07_9936 [Aspergillus flavus]|uniref:Uncharacterized protein n=1 Tax=Aspergillus flavus (strain ATCC 200026 / FGSC A1120 / IAM 13836 / NRRL 3357 / JCM 12722 / SRRC 167) TaxID=332952 RepID=A0A7U2MDG4_ASPFN|nr:hypothetical protein F9C07_9936 [Aspergillus flavus]GMF89270.1 unnamed protein product [Aspergillus oryzae]GMG03042.1 unnamed protein product [Aspergillus oryzae]
MNKQNSLGLRFPELLGCISKRCPRTAVYSLQRRIAGSSELSARTMSRRTADPWKGVDANSAAPVLAYYRDEEATLTIDCTPPTEVTDSGSTTSFATLTPCLPPRAI